MSFAAWAVILILLLSFLGLQDLCGGPAAVGWRIRICDADIKDCRPTSLPKAVGAYVSTEFWGQRCAVALGSLSLSAWDCGFVRHIGRFEGFGAKLVPLLSHVVVAGVNETSFLALESVFNSEALLAAIAAGREVEGGESKSMSKIVAKFLGGEDGVVPGVWESGEPCAGLLRAFQAPSIIRG